MKRTYYKIDGRIYLLNETAKVVWIDPDSALYDIDNPFPLYELMDITTEILDGHSYSFYATNVSHFQEATEAESKEANEYLINLK